MHNPVGVALLCQYNLKPLYLSTSSDFRPDRRAFLVLSSALSSQTVKFVYFHIFTIICHLKKFVDIDRKQVVVEKKMRSVQKLEAISPVSKTVLVVGPLEQLAQCRIGRFACGLDHSVAETLPKKWVKV